ncbi:type I pullulanase [Paenibacillus sp. FSL K6-1230]|uniref:type I pullulanase n=1 Tax=Paenibacillus sp. FSL K6-1230 TaxID=2921603 RepID=UPI0030F563E1
MTSNFSLATAYTDRMLGLSYTRQMSHFSLWAPTADQVKLVIYANAGSYDEEGQVRQDEGGLEWSMHRHDDGVWEACVAGDWAGHYYMYKLTFGKHDIRYAADPYGRAVTANGQRSAVLDLRSTDPAGWSEDRRPDCAHPTDAVIYELHVRDFSADPDADFEGDRGRFSAFTRTGLCNKDGEAIGLDHLKDLGITHVHLLPIADCHTIDELADPAHSPQYNWGYDPQHYNVPEGSYASDPRNPAVRIREFKELVLALHRAGIGVILDVVYNHTYALEEGPFEPIVPGYYYRQNQHGEWSNGSGVGNEVASERPMVRRYIKDSLRYWAEEYHVDGFRFDLLGLIDTPTVAELTKELREEVYAGMLIYGEPWTGGESPLQEKTLKGSQRGKGFAVFNDHFRGAIKGDSDGEGSGFATGAWDREGEIMQGVRGAIYDFTKAPSESINYVTAHDNLNLWDKIITVRQLRGHCAFPDWDQGEPRDGRSAEEAVRDADPYALLDQNQLMEDETVRRSLLSNGIVLTSQGIPFIHAGDEILRSKYGDHNSYRSGDAVNCIRWTHKTRFRAVFDYYAGLILLRRSHPAFRLQSAELVEQHLETLRESDHTVAYRLHSYAGGDTWRNIVVIYNGSDREQTMFLPEDSECWHIVVNERQAGTDTLGIVCGDRVTVPRWSIMVLHDAMPSTDPVTVEEQEGQVQVALSAEVRVADPVTIEDRGQDCHSMLHPSENPHLDLDPCSHSSPHPYRTITLYYERPDQSYEGWNVWVWGTGLQDGQISLERIEDGRAVAHIRVAPHVRRVGYILRLKQWEAKDIEMDRYIDIRPDEQHMQVLVRSGIVRETAV